MKVGRILGVQLVLNNLFLLMLLLWGILDLLPYALLTFSIVLLHELAHVLTAKSYGLTVRNIELFPFGGVARLEGLMEMDPGIEARIALAGPLSNFFLAGLTVFLKAKGIIEGEFSLFFIKGNLMLAFFNLLPALPLDGGRIFRAYLSRKMGHRKATEKTANLGRIMAVLLFVLGIGGIFGGLETYSLLILGPFIYFSASREREMAGYTFAYYLIRKKEELRKKGILTTEQLVVTEETRLGDVLKYFLPKKYHVILLMNKELSLQGIITESEIIDGLIDKGIDSPLKEILKHRF